MNDNCSPVLTLLERLDGVHATGVGRWIACCPAHDDRHPSLSIRELNDQRVLLHCHAGCPAGDVLNAVGLTLCDLFPVPLGGPEPQKSERRPFPAADVLRCVAFEALVVAMAGVALLDGRPFTPDDRARLLQAVARILAAVDVAGVRHG